MKKQIDSSYSGAVALTLNDLHDPRNIVQLFHWNKQHWITKGENQRFQEYPGSFELWQVLEDGRLIRVQRWLKKSVKGYTSKELEPC